MALMVLTRIPSSEDLERHSMDSETFLDAFSRQSVSRFTAKVDITPDGRIELDGWSLVPEQADWFEIE